MYKYTFFSATSSAKGSIYNKNDCWRNKLRTQIERNKLRTQIDRQFIDPLASGRINGVA